MGTPTDGSPVIRVEHVSLRYRVSREKVASIKEYAIRRLKRDLGFIDFWALKDISVDIEAGDVFGIVGRNGAG
ncbi:MAG TPA: ABC transporter ATP-binding protein, partial [Acidobacteria bacterium]|nr:ABC transporter ATP-binding protein [Acidobacteriota bacterium]